MGDVGVCARLATRQWLWVLRWLDPTDLAQGAGLSCDLLARNGRKIPKHG